MLVKDRMISDPVTVTVNTTVAEALEIIHHNLFRHLPVLDAEGNLVGVVTEKNLVYASQKGVQKEGQKEGQKEVGCEDSPADRSVGSLIEGTLVTVGPDLPIEEAARRMIDHRVDCLPVMKEGQFIGLINDTDIFCVLVEGLGGGHPSLRLTLVVPEAVGSLLKVVGCIVDLGGNIHSLGTFWGKGPEDRIIAFRLEGVDRQAAIRSLEEAEIEIVDVWEP
ncbi:MAG TPA: CBS domain-containing protein [Chloroflexi bacterium]|nr:CBS domain-containing protein [Chloroflexota bacterium]